ncbi:MAG: hypothetical protein WBM62_16670 [Crocosphaera sp.]|jgi:hypothetical protein
MLRKYSNNLQDKTFLSSNQWLDIENNFALILTATICVDNIPRVYPADKKVREQQYIETLTYYLHHHPRLKKIIFIENSASCLNNIKQVMLDNPYHKKVEFISLDTNLYYSSKGKGFGECLLMQEGLKQSEIIQTVTHFGKITGRIFLENITHILETIPANFDCICDYKDQGYRIKKALFNKQGNPFCDTRFIAFSKQFYSQYLEDLHTHFSETFPKEYFCIEVEYYKKIHSLEEQANIIKRFKIEPKFVGISGHSGGKTYGGKDYNSFPEQLKYKMRIIARKLIPSLHF